MVQPTRYTFGTELARAGVPLADTQALLGHSDPRLTAWVHTQRNTENLRTAVDGLAR